MTPERMSELVALGVGWTLTDGDLWHSPRVQGCQSHGIAPPVYYTNDAAAIRDVLPNITRWSIANNVSGLITLRFDSNPYAPPDMLLHSVVSNAFAAAICEAFAAANGGWDELEKRYG